MPAKGPWDGWVGMLKLVDTQRSVLIFLGVVTLIALGALVWPGAGWILDILTAVVAAGAAFMALARLALGAPNAAARWTWQLALILLGLTCIGQVAGGTFAALEPVAGSLLLATALVLLGLVGRLDPAPAATRSVLWLYHAEGYTHEEIAAAMGKSLSFSKSQLARGTRRLRVLLALEPEVAAHG